MLSFQKKTSTIELVDDPFWTKGPLFGKQNFWNSFPVSQNYKIKSQTNSNYIQYSKSSYIYIYISNPASQNTMKWKPLLSKHLFQNWELKDSPQNNFTIPNSTIRKKSVQNGPKFFPSSPLENGWLENIPPFLLGPENRLFSGGELLNFGEYSR